MKQIIKNEFISSEKETSTINVYDARDAQGSLLYKYSTIHSVPVRIMKYQPYANTVVSVDTGGMIEYWDPETGKHPGIGNGVDWEFKSGTDLYEFKKVSLK